jgi:hypothetical protein
MARTISNHADGGSLAAEQDESYQSSQTLTHAACAPPRHSLPLRVTPERFQVEFLIPIDKCSLGKRVPLLWQSGILLCPPLERNPNSSCDCKRGGTQQIGITIVPTRNGCVQS